MTYPKRLIEVDLPIKRISAHARREKSIRHGHISTLHIWWARRPLAACRAIICASLWPDPADPLCPGAFIEKARAEMLAWTSHERQQLLSAESRPHFESLRRNRKAVTPVELRVLLLDFIADFANWDHSTVREYLETSRALTQSAHEALGGAPGTRPLVVDPFCGGGSIPLEALRVGADAFASDLNPIPVLLNKVVLEYIPKYGQRLADEVRKWGEWIKREAEKELGEFYPKDPDGATPIAYLWARTIQCEGPGCGAEVPLIRSLWLAKKANRSVALQLVPNKKEKRVDFKIIVKRRGGWINEADPTLEIKNLTFDGLVKRGAATCPCCGYTTAVTNVRRQLKRRRGGAHDARLYCVVCLREGEQGRIYRVPHDRDIKVLRRTAAELIDRKQAHSDRIPLVPNEDTPAQDSHRSVGSARVYGMDTWEDLFSPRQALSLSVFSRLVRAARQNFVRTDNDGFGDAMQTLLAFAFDKLADLSNSLCRWEPNAECPRNLFGRQAIPMVWDFAEGSPIGESSGSWTIHINGIENALKSLGHDWSRGHVEQGDATDHPLPDDSSDVYFTDPPYYDAVPYGEVSDFFYVWLKRNAPPSVKQLFGEALTPKFQQAIVWHPDSVEERNAYEAKMGRAMSDGRRVLKPTGMGIIVFAHKTTSGWEAQLGSMVDAGWIVTASWPVDTECGSRMNAQGTAALASSVHLVCRPRENPDGSVRTDEIGDWRDVLQELPRRIHEWMPRLAEEGVVGADAIFACLGPALEIFSRYSRVEKASGEAVALKEYLEQVWAAVAKEALTMVFAGADATGFEPDARLTAMWLWTLNAGKNGTAEEAESAEAKDEESEGEGKKPKVTGFVLEYDAARKIAQGLGANLERLGSVIEVAGETARLLPVAERARFLFGKEEGKTPSKKKPAQLDLFKVLEVAESDGAFADASVSRPGETVLDRIHQSMILFAAGRAEAVKRFLVEDGVGRDQRFWRLAQALSALYPAATDEKRWVDGVLARKKGLGL